jgi:hypothetical protein
MLGRAKALAPTCNICLIKKDQATVWCEVTYSVNEKDDREVQISDTASEERTNKKESSTKVTVNTTASSDCESLPRPEQKPVKELLLCLRPIRDGDVKLEEKFKRSESRKGDKRTVSDSSFHASAKSQKLTTPSGDSAPDKGEKERTSARPMKKRKRMSEEGFGRSIKLAPNDATKNEDDKDVVECLMLMSNDPKNV